MLTPAVTALWPLWVVFVDCSLSYHLCMHLASHLESQLKGGKGSLGQGTP